MLNFKLPVRCIIAAAAISSVPGCGGAAGAPSRETVHGRVVDSFGQPFPDVSATIGDATTWTDANGRFSIVGVGPVYDVTLLPNLRSVYSYQGMSRRDPVFTFADLVATPSANHYAKVVFDMGGPDTASVETTQVIELGGSVHAASMLYNNTSGAQKRTFGVYWMGDDPAPIVLHAFQFRPDGASGGAASYLSHDAFEGVIGSTETLTWSPSWKPMDVPLTTIALSASLPSGYSIWSARLAVRSNASSPDSSFLWVSPVGPQISFLIPDLPAATYTVEVLASDTNSNSSRTVRGIQAHAAPLNLVVEPGPVIVSPGDGAQDISVGSELSWTNDTAGVEFVNFIPKDFDGNTEYRITTASSPARIPDLRALGVDLPHRASYQWSVFLTSADSVDDLAAHGTENRDLLESTYAYSGYIDVTTK